jgi:hypothetical protein
MEKLYVPHSPREFGSIIPKARFTLPSDLLTNFTCTMVPLGSYGGGASQELDVAMLGNVGGILVGTTRTGKVGNGVNAGSRVGVGGMEVAVGSAACVI